MRTEEGYVGHTVTGCHLGLPLLTITHSQLLIRGKRCAHTRKTAAGREGTGVLLVCGGFFNPEANLKARLVKEVKMQMIFSVRLKPILTGVGATVPFEEATGRFGVVLPEQRSGLKLKPKHQQPKSSPANT